MNGSEDQPTDGELYGFEDQPTDGELYGSEDQPTDGELDGFSVGRRSGPLGTKRLTLKTAFWWGSQ